MFGFAGLGLLLLLQITVVVQLIHRLFLVIRTPKVDGKRWKTAAPEMRAWRLSAVEPIVTTILTIPTLIMATSLLFEQQNPTILIVLYVIPIISMMIYSWRINKHGEGHRLARLANSVIGARVVLLSTSLFFFMRRMGGILEGELHQLSLSLVIAPVVCAFFIRAAFAVHQNLVIDKMDVDAAALRNRPTTLIENNEDSKDNKLWDEQMALIERLKEEEMVEV